MAPDALYTIDSISDGIARLEAPDGTLITVPADRLPADAREGEVLAVSAGGAKPGQSGDWRTVTFRRDPDATEARRQSVRGKLDRLRRRGQA